MTAELGGDAENVGADEGQVRGRGARHSTEATANACATPSTECSDGLWWC